MVYFDIIVRYSRFYSLCVLEICTLLHSSFLCSPELSTKKLTCGGTLAPWFLQGYLDKVSHNRFRLQADDEGPKSASVAERAEVRF
jgi:hypothetical protein